MGGGVRAAGAAAVPGGGAILFGLGVAVARALGHGPDLRLYLLGQGVVTSFQLMTHYANDYFDFEADRANRARTRWSGGSGVLARGELPRSVALVTAFVLAVVGLVLTGLGPGPVAPVGVAMFVFSWIYSAPPFRLHSRGLGELDVALVVTGLVPLLGTTSSYRYPGAPACACCCWPCCRRRCCRWR